MLNIPELEKKWLRYKIKSFIPYLLLSTAFVAGIVGYFLYQSYSLNSKNSITPIVKYQKKADLNKSIVTAAKAKTDKKLIKNNTAPLNAEAKKVKPPVSKIEIVKLDPSMEFINNFKPLEPSTKVTSADKEKKEKVLPAKKPKPKIVVTQKNISSRITIKKEDSAKDLQSILKRFQKDKNPALSLFLAKKYYELGDYKNASNYALITNKLNKDIEDSWLIFSKSLVKLHQKKKAINILTQYIKATKSNNAAILLNEIQSGAFQ